MNRKSYITAVKTSKIVELIITILIDVIFFLLLLLRPELRNNIFANKTLTFLCVFVWLIMLYVIIFLFVDMYYLRKLAIESHQLNQLAYLDDLTHIPNRASLDLLFRKYRTPDAIAKIGCCMLTISNLTEINECIGRDAGDSILREFCNIFEKVGDRYGFVGRNSGNEFILIIEECTDDLLNHFKKDLSEKIAMYNKDASAPEINLKFATIINSDSQYKQFGKLLSDASQILYNELT